jgi:hypothetical protein
MFYVFSSLMFPKIKMFFLYRVTAWNQQRDLSAVEGQNKHQENI